MDDALVRATLARLIAERHENYGALSRLLGRNAAYIQQYITRGSPRRLDESDRRLLARYFGVDEKTLGAPDTDETVAPILATTTQRRLPPMVAIQRLALGASAGAGGLDPDERRAGTVMFDRFWLRDLGARAEMLSIIRVDGESMTPTLNDGDDIMVDRGDGVDRLREGIYVLRLDDMLMVKRIVLGPRRGRLSVRSDNQVFQAWEDVDPVRIDIVGRVIWTGRRLN